jgi:hypothetical protein
MDKSKSYQDYAGHLVREVPTESLLVEMVESFYYEAALNMGTNTKNRDSQRDVSRIVYLLKNSFNHLPVSLVASAFVKGSLGELDDGRLVPRTVYNWLKEISSEYMRKKDHEELQEKLKDTPTTFDLQRYPVGQAINKKSDWLRTGMISESDWDKIPLKDLAERIASGLPAVPEFFGVKSRKV